MRKLDTRTFLFTVALAATLIIVVGCRKQGVGTVMVTAAGAAGVEEGSDGDEAEAPAGEEQEVAQAQATAVPTPTEAATAEATATPAGAETPEASPSETQEEAEGQEDEAQGFSVAPVATPGGELPDEVSVQLVKIAEGLVDPINVVSPRDDTGRLFIIERPGRIRIAQDGELLEEPFLDITDKVLSAFLEQGLYDIEFHPDFANNGLFYVHFAELLRNGDSIIVQYQVSDDDPNVADPESARVILQIDQPYANHNGGELAFGPDGFLYIGSGDGGWEGDPLEAGQDLSTLLGKILRIDVNVEGVQPYAIPEDNPFAQPAGLVELFNIPESTFAQIHSQARPEIWAYGLRNPWKFNFDSDTGELYIADVGQNHWEEINFQAANSEGGENYGWDFLMGSHCFPIEAESCPAVGVLPVAEYSHDLGHAVVGIGVYRGETSPEMQGIYFAGDYGSGRIWGLVRGDEDNWTFAELLHTGLHLTGAGEDEAGNLFVTTCECEYGGPGPFENPPGTLWQLVAADQVPEDAEVAPTATSEPEQEGEAEGNVVQVSLTEFNIDMPTEIPAGTVTFEVSNDGSAVHNFEVEGQGIEEVFETNLQPGESRTMEVDLQAGTYEVYCPVGNHREMGMELELTVTESSG